MKNFYKKTGLTKAVFLHLFFAGIFFFPFLSCGQYFVGGEGNFLQHFPNLIFCHRAFNAGEWGFWNPYLYGGMDFTASGDNVIFDPLNWLMFIFPEQRLFFLLTLRMFFETWLIGVFGYFFLKEALGDTKWAFFSAAIYQITVYLYFGLLVYSSLTVDLFFTLSLYLIYTLHKRKAWLSFFFLSLSLSEMLLASQLTHGLTALVITIVVAIRRYKTFLKGLMGRKVGIILAASFLTSLTLASVRLFPFFYHTWHKGSDFRWSLLPSIGVLPGLFFLAALVIMNRKREKEPSKINRSFFWGGAFLLVIANLISFGKVYSSSNMTPFFSGTLYPSKDKIFHSFKVMPNLNEPNRIEHSRLVRSWNDYSQPVSGWEDVDTKNYRVNRPEIFLGIFRRFVWSDIGIVYNIRSLGGRNGNAAGNFYNDFIGNFTQSSGHPNAGMSVNEKGKRLLDLLGCRYDIDSFLRPVVRETALSRFMFFKNFKTRTDEETLSELRDQKFNPFASVILAGTSGLKESNAQTAAEQWPYVHRSNSVLEVHLKNKTPGVLFFGDSYHEDWKAFINGKKVPVIQANYNFMGVPVPTTGKTIVTLRFEPRAFYCGIYGFNMGLCWLFLGVGYFYVEEKGWLKLKNCFAISAGLILMMGGGSLNYFLQQGAGSTLLESLVLMLYGFLFYILIVFGLFLFSPKET